VAKDGQKKITSWLWPISLMATAAAGFGMVLYRGCWHRKMSWPVRSAGQCYQVCTGCGIKRLFDEEYFRAYGPYSYDLDKLSSYKRARQVLPKEKPTPEEHRSAS